MQHLKQTKVQQVSAASPLPAPEGLDSGSRRVGVRPRPVHAPGQGISLSMVPFGFSIVCECINSSV